MSRDQTTLEKWQHQEAECDANMYFYWRVFTSECTELSTLAMFSTIVAGVFFLYEGTKTETKDKMTDSMVCHKDFLGLWYLYRDIHNIVTTKHGSVPQKHNPIFKAT